MPQNYSADWIARKADHATCDLRIPGLFVLLRLMAAGQIRARHRGQSACLQRRYIGRILSLSRRMCLALGAVGLVLGLAGPAAVWTYGSLCIKGDPSGYGMLGTLLAYVFIPVGAGLLLVGCRKEV